MTDTPLFDPRWVERLGALVFRSRGPTEGMLAGRHASPRQGRMGEFVDRRVYVPGDDRRRIDWKYFARSDRWTVREDREDTHQRVVLLIDVSSSMAFSAEGRFTKIRYAAGLSAGLGFVLQQSGDALGWGFFEHTLLSLQSPRSGPEVMPRFTHHLPTPGIGKGAHFKDSFLTFRAQSPGRMAVVVLSDFLGSLDDIFAGFRVLCSSGQDISALQVLDPVELDLSFKGVRRFEDLEGSDWFRGDPDVLAESYQQKMDERQRVLSQRFSSLSVSHHLCRTDQPIDEGLALFLKRRTLLR